MAPLTLPTYAVGNTNIWIEFQNEFFYQMLVEYLLKGHHKKLICGMTDVTNETCHAEIKDWSQYKHAIGQIMTYNIVDRKPSKEIYMFGDATEVIKNVVMSVTAGLNIHLFEFCTYDLDKQQVFLFYITLNKHVCNFVPFDKDITINYSNQILINYREVFLQNNKKKNHAITNRNKTIILHCK